jgi:hypothetical protein
MKTKLTIAIVLFAIGATWLVSPSRVTSPPIPAPEAPPAPVAGNAATADLQWLAHAADRTDPRRLAQATDRMEKQLLPLLEKVPEAMKQMKQLVAESERLARQAETLRGK